MLPQEFFDWWFAPWNYAAATLHPAASDLVGQRDGYRLWCEEAGIAADLPAQFDAGWHVAAAIDGAQLAATARLYGGLFAARQHDQALLNRLAFEERKWCISIAATQPLFAAEGIAYAADDSIELRGLVELARRLQDGFPGMWTRLRLLLPQGLADRTEALLATLDHGTQKKEAAAMRAQRCWVLCESRAALLQVAEPLAA